MSLIGFFWRYSRRYAGWAALAFAAVLGFAVSTVGLVALIEPIFGEVLLAGEDRGGLSGLSVVAGGGGGGGGDAAAADEAAAPEGFLDDLRRRFDISEQLDRSYRSLKERLGVGPDDVVWFVPVLLVLVFLLRSVAGFLSGYSFQHLGLGVTTDIRNDLYRHILEQSSRFFARHPSGELVSRVISDIALIQSAVSNRLLDLAQQSITLVFLLGMLLSIHFELALLCLVAAPVLIYPIVRFGKGMRRTSHRSQERMADLAALMSEAVRGHRVVKAFGMEEFEYARFRAATRRHLKVNLWAQMLANLSSPVVETLAVVGAAALLVYAGRAVRGGELSTPELLKFLTTLVMMYDPIRKLNKVNLILQEAAAAAQRVKGVMDEENEVASRQGTAALATVERDVAFEGVSFAYEVAEQPVLHDVDLTIRRGEIVALVGPSGAGKSTMVNLLPRFFDPDRGRVAIDGVDLRDMDLKALRALIGIVTQDTVLFDDTVRANIAYGRGDLPLERVREAAAAAYADDFVMRMPGGYETRIGESGLRLSGGQRQRLAIARALLKNAPILILDEATSHLDTESESLVQKALYNLMQGRTTLVIAHRLSTVQRADRIVVLDGGRIVETGTHQELLDLGGSYKRLYDLQFRV
jgi:subfamily B ATP-binding cassette protein MsbA